MSKVNLKSPETWGALAGLGFTLFVAITGSVSRGVNPLAILVVIAVGVVSTAIGVLLGRLLLRRVLKREYRASQIPGDEG
jgi:hypothetical protein